MNCFDYPIEASFLLSKKRKIQKELEQSLGKNAINKRIAILGGSTTYEVKDQLNLFLLHHGIRCEFYMSEYGRFWEDSVFPSDELMEFKPDIVYIHTNWRNISAFPTLNNNREEIEELLDLEYGKYEQAWDSLSYKFKCIIIQNNFERPNCRILGNRDIWDSRGKSNYVSMLNAKIYEYARVHDNFYVNDIDYLSAEFGLTKWNDSTYWYMYKYAMSLQAIPLVAKSVSDIIKSVLGKNKKLLALDMDNTLWGGVIGDEGLDGIRLGCEEPVGRMFLDFQKYCKELQSAGVVLAVDSKNDESNAILGLNHPYSVLSKEDFVSIKANWNSKDRNLYEIATELDLGTDSFVFVDDNPAERYIVSEQIPSVSVLDCDKPDQFIQNLDHSGYFEVTTISDEDLQKTKMYHAKSEAKQQREGFADYGEYLNSLEMIGEVKPFDSFAVQRIAQLTNKSNQFNLTTLRCTEADIVGMANASNWITLYARLSDKFTEHGIVTVVAGEMEGAELHIRLWLMSCRVLKRDLEYLLLDKLVDSSVKKGVKRLIGYYYPTEKNSMVNSFYSSMGFDKIKENTDGSTVWNLNIDSYEHKNKHIKMMKEGI